MRRIVVIAVSAAAVVALFGGLFAVAATRAHRARSAATTGAANSVAAPQSGSAFTVRTVTGAQLRVPAGKPTVLFFFTGECGSCYTGAKNLATVLASTGSRADVVAVELDPSEPADILNQFLAAVGNPPFSVVRDDGSLLRRFHVDALGTTVVVDSTGREIFRGVDPPPARILQALTAAGMA